MNETRHVFDEHRSEVRMRAFAPTLAGIFEEAARAMCELVAGEVAAPEGEPISVKLEAADREALFCDWLNEIVYLSETRKQVFPEARVERVSDRELVATLRGVAPGAIRTPVKAATMHDLFVRPKDEGWEASIVLDV